MVIVVVAVVVIPLRRRWRFRSRTPVEEAGRRPLFSRRFSHRGALHPFPVVPVSVFGRERFSQAELASAAQQLAFGEIENREGLGGGKGVQGKERGLIKGGRLEVK